MKNRFLSVIVLIACLLTSCEEKPAKYVFLFIGDGMGTSQVSLTESYLSYMDGRFGGTQLQFTQFPYFGMCRTSSANSLITDSAAAGTAIATGYKTNNGYIGMDAEGNPIYSVGSILKRDYGYQVGIFSSVPLNHATPAAFYGHTDDRRNTYIIANQIPESGFEFIGGSGILDFYGSGDVPDCEAFLENNGYDVVFGQSEFDKSESHKIVMVSNPMTEHKGKVANYEAQEDKLVTLPEMMKNCLKTFDENKPFFIMCEGGEIDWTSHADKVMPTIEAMLYMNEAVKLAYEFYLKHPKETLIIVTADHQTGGVSLGSKENGYEVNWQKIIEQWNAAGQKDNFATWEDRIAFNRANGIGWTTTHHCADQVPIYAVGVGAEKFCGAMENTDIIRKIIPERK